MTLPAVLFRDGTADAAAPKSLLCTNVQSTYAIHDQDSFSTALDAADYTRAQGAVAVFALDYELGGVLEPAALTRRGKLDAVAAPRGYVWIFSEAAWLTQSQADAWLRARGTDQPAGCALCRCEGGAR